MLLARDELNGWLGNFDAYKRGAKGGDAAHYLEMHRAGTIVMDRKTGGEPLIYVPRAALSIVGTTHPETFIRALGREHFENGLLPRFLTVLPPRSVRTWSDRTPPPEAVAAYAGVVRRLYRLGLDTRPEVPVPHLLKLSPEAKELWVAFYNKHGQEQLDLDGDLAGAWSKLEGYCARLALVLQLARWAAIPPPPRTNSKRPLAEKLAGQFPPEMVEAPFMDAAITLIGWFSYEARRVYSVLSDEEEDRESHRLTDWIRARGGAVTVRDLQKSGHPLYRDRAEDAEKALERLVAAGVGEWVWMEPGPRGGRATRQFQIVVATQPH
jgi:hypothetical protein